MVTSGPIARRVAVVSIVLLGGRARLPADLGNRSLTAIFRCIIPRYNSVLTGLTLISTLHMLYADKFEMEEVIRLLGNERALNGLKHGDTPAGVLHQASVGVRDFLTKRQKALNHAK